MTEIHLLNVEGGRGDAATLPALGRGHSRCSRAGHLNKDVVLCKLAMKEVEMLVVVVVVRGRIGSKAGGGGEGNMIFLLHNNFHHHEGENGFLANIFR